MTVPEATDKTERADLIGWLREQIADDERGALACTERHWRPDGAKSCQVYVVPSDLSTRTIAWCSNGYDDDFANSLHIARHDPARVLAEVEAKRRLLDAIFAYEAKIDSEWGCCHSAEDIAAGNCPDTELRGIPALRFLALPYADRPGYRPEWRP